MWLSARNVLSVLFLSMVLFFAEPSLETAQAIWKAVASNNTGLMSFAAFIFGLVGMIYQYCFRPIKMTSKDFFTHHDPRFKALRRKWFPPPYPNGWYNVCCAEDLVGGRVKSISALGRHMVAFRGKDGKVGVLDAFCPHMGAHLGQGGKVVDGCLQCPFHEWRFRTDGSVSHIPYIKQNADGSIHCDNPPERAKTKAYHVREILGIVFIWFHAEGGKPLWELKQHKDVEEGLASRNMYFGVMRHMEFDQHVCEMHMNSADSYHFQTLHGGMPLPGFSSWISCFHETSTKYYTPEKHMNTFKENMKELKLFGWIPVPFSKFVCRYIDTTVTFEGPNIFHFRIKTPIGTFRQLKTTLPIEPFKQYVEIRWYATYTIPRFFLWVLSVVGKTALNQDRQVWENKLYHGWSTADNKLHKGPKNGPKPLLVPGDGKFPGFMKWYYQFYSEGSNDLDNPTNLHDW